MLILLGWLSIFYYALQSCFKVVYLSSEFFLYWLAVKAKTVGEVIKNRPPAGVLDAALAAEYKVFSLRKCINHLDLISFCQNCVEL